MLTNTGRKRTLSEDVETRVCDSSPALTPIPLPAHPSKPYILSTSDDRLPKRPKYVAAAENQVLQSSHRAEHNTLNDRSRLNLGDRHNNTGTVNYYHTTSNNVEESSAERGKDFMGLLRFDQIDARHATIKTAHVKTCKWLLSRSEYRDWHDPGKISEHHGFLWIKGKPGTGKSTIMKFAHATARKKMTADNIVISFFFNARGGSLERSTEGMYRSLLFQMLERVPRLQHVFDSLEPKLPDSSKLYIWNINSLKELFRLAVADLGEVCMTCYIDALDECDEDEIRDMVAFFEQLPILNEILFHVCFSSRHYPRITISKSRHLTLEGQEGHQQDIQNYIQTELRIGNSKLMQWIKAEILRRASGIFLWVVLVVRILNKDYDRGRVHVLKERLNEIPDGLDELFRDILTRDMENMDELIFCLQWILHAKRLLKPEEFYFAVLSGTQLSTVTVWDPEEATTQVIDRFVVSSSKGLAETTKAKQPTVQFIHESVKDYLIKEKGLEKLQTHASSNFGGSCHEHLKDCCQKYMSIALAGHLPLETPLPKASSNQAKTLRKLASEKFPFLEYAVHMVLQHAESAQGHGMPQEDFLAKFPLVGWITLDNLFQQYENRRHTIKATKIYILAENNVPYLSKIEVNQGPYLSAENERYSSALGVAAVRGYQQIVQLLLHKNVDANSDAETHCSSLQAASYKGYIEVVQMLLEKGADVNALGRKYGSALQAASCKGHDKVVQMLLNKGADVNAQGQGGRSSNALQAASEEGHDKIVQILLDKGVDVNAQSGYYGNALEAASARGRDKIVQMLLDNGADINAQGGNYGNALQAASFSGYDKVVQILLDKGADINAQGGYFSNALQAASEEGHDKIIQILLDKGADVNAQGGYFGNALQAASRWGYSKIVQMLLDKGADVNAQGGYFGNALQAASRGGHDKIVQILLDKGADINAQGGYFGNALQAASRGGHDKIVQILLDKGADINAQGGYFGNALQAASRGGHDKIVQILLDKGIDFNAQRRYFSNALLAASEGGHDKIVQILLDKGIDFNAQRGYFGNALQAASRRGYSKILQMLLDKGADVNAQGGYFGNALQAASRRGHDKTVRMLLDKGADVNAQGGLYGKNALQAASEGGHNEIVQMLLDKGAADVPFPL